MSLMSKLWSPGTGIKDLPIKRPMPLRVTHFIAVSLPYDKTLIDVPSNKDLTSDRV